MYTAARLASGTISFEEVGPVLTEPIQAISYQRAILSNGLLKGNIPVLDVQYNGQVIGSKERSTGKIDSIQLRKNVAKLLQQSREAQNDSAGIINAPRVIAFDTTTNNINPVPVKTNNPPKPKAVMNKKTNN